MPRSKEATLLIKSLSMCVRACAHVNKSVCGIDILSLGKTLLFPRNKRNVVNECTGNSTAHEDLRNADRRQNAVMLVNEEMAGRANRSRHDMEQTMEYVQQAKLFTAGFGENAGS